MGFGSFLKKVAHIALPIAGAYFGGPIGAALASAADSKLIEHQGWGDTLKNAGISAAGAGLTGTNGTLFSDGGAFSGSALGDINSGITGAFSPIRSGISSLFSGAGDYLSNLTNGTSLSSADSPLTSAARTATSAGATAATPTTNFMTNYLPGGGGSVAGGGTSGGFFDFPTAGKTGVAGDFARGLAGESTPSAFASAATNTATSAPSGFSSFLENPVGYAKDSIVSGAKDMFTPSNIAKGTLKGGLAYLLSKDNSAGYGGVQNAATQAAANYQPFLDTGTGSTKTLADLYGLNGADAAKTALDNWQIDPGFTFARDQGIKSLDASAARNGNLLSGNQLQAVQGYGTGLANQYFQQYLQNLQKSAGAGQTAAEGVGNNMIDAATAAAILKGQNAQRYNQMIGSGLSSFL